MQTNIQQSLYLLELLQSKVACVCSQLFRCFQGDGHVSRQLLNFGPHAGRLFGTLRILSTGKVSANGVLSGFFCEHLFRLLLIKIGSCTKRLSNKNDLEFGIQSSLFHRRAVLADIGMDSTWTIHVVSVCSPLEWSVSTTPTCASVQAVRRRDRISSFNLTLQCLSLPSARIRS